MGKYDQGTGPDGLGLYLTGAASDGGTQTNPDASLGNFRSSTEVAALGAIVGNGLPSLIINQVADKNTSGGTGTIRSNGSAIYYTPPGGSEGPAVIIIDGETKIAPGANPDKFIRVTRSGSTLKVDSASLSITDIFNNAVGMSNITNAQRVAGVTTYRALMLRSHGPRKIKDIKIWLGAMTGTQSTISIGLEAVGGGNNIQTIVDENTAPTGIVWSAPTTEATGLSIAELATAINHGLWVRRVFPAAGNVKEREIIELEYSFQGV